MSAEAPIVVPFFKKKGKSRPTTQRKRSASPNPGGPSSASSSSTVVLPTRKVNHNLLAAGTKRSLTDREREERDLDLEADNDNGPDVKWSSSKSHITLARDIIAGDEAEELMMAKRARTNPDDGDGDDVPDDGQYHGQKAYKSHIQKSKEVPKAMRVGPQRGSSTIRTVTIVDYQPDVCKDYKETGYCGFGDTCKFLHDRGTYLAGWQLDKLAENPQKQVGDASDDDDSDDEDIPFACLICRKEYTDPIVTRCGHYFCSRCAIKRFGKTPRCLACGAPTGGIFNRADKVIEKMRKKKADREKEDEGDESGGEKGVQIEGLGEVGGQGSDEDD
ncbi:spliceosomal zinc finger-containing protein [Pterulicium gracile]|uniref:Pre-mRNA-splicing factor CWC24 n=1 Tax=Pterulicium gracile TaxID=1884261 RepID=A0A5C3QM60_9AGAR|nr:spliceosomal zinc finger-containing protein [Pterula gracilis]